MRALLVTLLSSFMASPAGEPVAEAAPSAQTCVTVKAIGALPLTIEVAGTRVEFNEWMAKDIDATELIGFRATTTGPVSFVVRAGSETFEADGSQWQNPHGVVGRAVHGIDGLEVCK